eukprot:gene9833-29973_t
MSSIEKLLIQGVRSFSPEQHQVIEFTQSPLTLIVGPNGSGKTDALRSMRLQCAACCCSSSSVGTTIIEALKFITTGNHPAGGNGAAFVHDPKVLNEREVKARVKLQFKDQTGNRLVVTRTMEVTQTAKTQKYKTLESSIQKIDSVTKEKSTLSSRCAEIDSLITERMGVSEEDSAWPLGTAKDLKDKFDAIFSATRYTKALENIKKFRKEQQQKCITYKAELTHLKTHQDTAKDMRETLERTVRQIEASGRKIEQIDEELEPIAKELGTLQSSISQREELKRNQGKLEAKLTQTFDDDSDAELRKRMDDFEANIASQQSRLEGDERKLRDISNKKKSSERDLGNRRTEHGALEHAAKEHDRKVKHRDELVAQFAQTQSMPGFGAGTARPFSITKVRDFNTETDRLERQHVASIETIEAEH